MKDDVRPTPRPRREDDGVLLRKELRRRGLGPEQIEQALRKKRRRKQLEFDLVKSRRSVSPQKISPPAKAKTSARPPTTRPASSAACTVAVAAELLGMHPKTVLRFIRSGQLPARRVGKSYRIDRRDLEAFSGVPAPPVANEAPRMTSIIEVPNVGAAQARRWSAAVADALRARTGGGVSAADVIHEADQGRLKIVVTGEAGAAAEFVGLVRDWLARLA